MIAQFLRVLHLEHLIKGIFNDGVSQASCDIRYSGSFFLGLFYLGVHKYRTTRPQVDWHRRQETFLSKVCNRNFETLGKGIQEGPTPSRTSFIKNDVFNIAVSDFTAFHILATNVQDEGYLWAEEASRSVMSHGFNFSNIDAKGPFQKGFPVTSNT